MDIVKKTKETYSFLWRKEENLFHLADTSHFNKMQEVVDETIIREGIGIDIGSGCGYDTYIMAVTNPHTRIISMDISDGVFAAKRLVSRLKNVELLKCSVLEMPFKNSSFDFAYSFGVLHHTTSPEKALLEIARVLKKKKPVFLYLYEDHSENIIKYIAIKVIAGLRGITVKIPSRVLYRLCLLFSPFVYTFFSLPTKILKRFSISQNLASKIPFNFGSSFFSLTGDLYDRFSAPIEHRFTRQGVYEMFTESGFSAVHITRMNDIAGWVAWGHKE